ncbi:MAG TPA: type I-D CRISPR-associated protein Cas7/Csc2 [Chloroflexota bacterium]|nr:type I-D CRISPR-associated protein Cas7/Csc2 [Chloroflexota bacterium]HUM67997.1 type I-D CRISPR-associated protein Cas7/Csc2 [Chloroflexota bacterium]
MSSLDLLKPFTVTKPEPIIGAKTIQLILMREVLDYTVLRTEDTRELNTVATPLSIENGQNTMRVAFLATKQKAAESRQMEQMLRTANEELQLAHLRRTIEQGGKKTEITLLDKKQDKDVLIDPCYLKDNLCLVCPRCGLYGATSTQSGQQDRANIKHRLEYSTAFSLLPFEDIESATTFNALNDLNQTTGQALGSRYAVVPATIFPSIVTLRSVTLTEAILTIKTLLACKSYGAESRIGGDMRNSIFGIIAGWEEVITPLELTLELYEGRSQINGEVIEAIAKKYKPLSGNPDRVRIYTADEVDNIVKGAAETSLNQEFLQTAYADIANYREAQIGKKK